MAKATIKRARTQRRVASFTEQVLWKLLRDRRLVGLKFRRQVPMGRYIADFVCLSPRLLIEADGPFHDPLHDAERDAWFAAQGYRVLRFANAEIHDNATMILERILVASGRADFSRDI